MQFLATKMQQTKKDLACLVDKNLLIGLDLDEENSNEKRCQTCSTIQVHKTCPACTVAAFVFDCSHRFHRYLDLCGMFDRSLCRTIVAMYVLRRKGKIATHLHFVVECTSLTTSIEASLVFDLGFAVRRGYSAFFFQ